MIAATALGVERVVSFALGPLSGIARQSSRVPDVFLFEQDVDVGLDALAADELLTFNEDDLLVVI